MKNCTESQKHQKEIHRHIWEDYLDEAEHLRHTVYNREKYKKEKKRLNAFLQTQRKNMECATPSIEAWKKSGAYNACFCRNESEKISYLAVGAYVVISFIIQK